MTKYKFSKRSLNSIEGLDIRLVIVLGLMLQASPYDFIVTEGVRSQEQQRKYLEEGKSMTMKSKHLTGDAFDIAIIHPDTKLVTWDIRYYKEFAEVLINLARKLGFNIRWGGTFKKKDGTPFLDGPHFELMEV